MEPKVVEAKSFLEKPAIQSIAQKKVLSRKKSINLKKSADKRKWNGKTKLAKKPPIKTTGSAKRKLASNRPAGWKIPYIKRGGLLAKMKLKKGDIVRQIEGRPMYSKKQVYKTVNSLSKKKKFFTMSLTRSKKNLLISYKVKPFKTRKRFIIAGIKHLDGKATGKTAGKTTGKSQTKRKSISVRKKQKIRRKLATAQSQRPPQIKNRSRLAKTNRKAVQAKSVPAKNKKTATKSAVKSAKPKTSKLLRQSKTQSISKNQKTKKSPAPKKSLVPKKYKPHLQLAYVASLNSFVYDRPNFDAQKLYSLSSGQKVLISKKIFRPPHKFGSFYKIFLFREKKLVGYVSEAEVIPEFINQDKQSLPNPAYKIAKKQMAKNKVLDMDLAVKTKKKNSKKRKPSALKDYRKRYAGLTLGFGGENVTALRPEDVHAGLKLSGYNLLISYLNLDMNLTASVYDFKSFYFDILATFPVLKAQPYYLFAMGGGNISIDRNKQDDPVDYGLSGALSLLIPITEKLLFRTDAKINHDIRSRSIRYGLFGSLQIGF